MNEIPSNLSSKNEMKEAWSGILEISQEKEFRQKNAKAKRQEMDQDGRKI